MPELDIAASRAIRNYSKCEMMLRVLWSFGNLMFRLTPGPCFGWRRWILACFGAKLGYQVRICASSRIYFPWNLAVGDWSAIGEGAQIYNLGPTIIGQKVTISHGAHLCAGTHDYNSLDFRLLKPPIKIEDQAWICAEAFVGPGVTIGQGAVVGARAVVTKNVEPWQVVVGNPSRRIGVRTLHRTTPAVKLPESAPIENAKGSSPIQGNRRCADF
jgi:putative colanic acid biosynthesis acetyltransferase WcaF